MFRYSDTLEFSPTFSNEPRKRIVRIPKITYIYAALRCLAIYAWLSVAIVREAPRKVPFILDILALRAPSVLCIALFAAIPWPHRRHALTVHRPQRRRISCPRQRTTHRNIVRSAFGKARLDMYNTEKNSVPPARKNYINFVGFKSVTHIDFIHQFLFLRIFCNIQIDPVPFQKRSIVTDEHFFESPASGPFPALREIEPCELGRVVKWVTISSIDDEPPKVRWICMRPNPCGAEKSPRDGVSLDCLA